MEDHSNRKKYIGVDTVMNDFDVSKPKAYAIIHALNEELKKSHPAAIIVAGKVNRVWYDKACLAQSLNNHLVKEQ